MTSSTSGPKGKPIEARSQRSQWSDRSFTWLTRLMAFGVAAVLVFIGVQVAIDAMPAIRRYGLEFLVTSSWNPVDDAYGALPVIYGTLVSSFIALLLAVPIGVGTALFLSEDFLPRPVRTVLSFMVEMLAAIPSVVYGIWGIFVLIPFLGPIGDWLHQNLGWIPLFGTAYLGPGMLPAALVLTVMILPIITAIARDSLISLPPALRQAALGMGATRWTAIFRVLIPAAFSGIVGGIMLALGRAMGETMAVTMLIGNSNDLNISILAPANTVASLLANQFAEAGDLQIAALMYAGLVLFGLTLVVNILAEMIVQRVNVYK
ncbi:phosphate ABC transporter permease subunit PstC [Nodosilinea nodulosa]|uniref:phosphate ABC transporter permease subunit PstC n=1 Tax=Nodosilinea nodulosa TaxID=416001 RepID=UPI0002F989E2|nr:phosphate ABC transporter permease subunit PstC [Nodosilinea nodulosa]